MSYTSRLRNVLQQYKDPMVALLVDSLIKDTFPFQRLAGVAAGRSSLLSYETSYRRDRAAFELRNTEHLDLFMSDEEVAVLYSYVERANGDQKPCPYEPFLRSTSTILYWMVRSRMHALLRASIYKNATASFKEAMGGQLLFDSYSHIYSIPSDEYKSDKYTMANRELFSLTGLIEVPGYVEFADTVLDITDVLSKPSPWDVLRKKLLQRIDRAEKFGELAKQNPEFIELVVDSDYEGPAGGWISWVGWLGAIPSTSEVDITEEYLEERLNRHGDVVLAFGSEDVYGNQYDLVVPWVARVVNAWLKAAQLLRPRSPTIAEIDSLGCVDWTKVDPPSRNFADTQDEYWDEDFVKALSPAGIKFVDTLARQRLKSRIHHASLVRLHEVLPNIVSWVNDKKTKVDLLKLTAAEAFRAGVAYGKRQYEEADAPKTVVYKDDKYLFTELKTKEELEREGACQNHCVGGYWQQVRDGRSRIISMRTLDNARIATIELEYDKKAGQHFVTQIKGRGNSELTDPNQKMSAVRAIMYVSGQFEGGSSVSREYRDQIRAFAAEYINQRREGDILQGLWVAAARGGVSDFISQFGRR